MSDHDLIRALQRNLSDADVERRRLEELVAALKQRIDHLDCTAACGDCKACHLFEAKGTIDELRADLSRVLTESNDAYARGLAAGRAGVLVKT